MPHFKFDDQRGNVYALKGDSYIFLVTYYNAGIDAHMSERVKAIKADQYRTKALMT